MGLYDFQLEAVEKLTTVRASLIGDQMGTGKTVTTINLDQERRKRWESTVPAKTLVVCPLGVVDSWYKHFRKWNPELDVFPIDPKDTLGWKLAVPNGSFDVYITHYQGLRVMDLSDYPWFHVIADEVHALQDPHSQQTCRLKQIPAFYKTGLSGTPEWHKPDDFWSVLNWLYPKYWDDLDEYRERYCRKNTQVTNAQELQRLISGFYVARKKEDVLKDLPPLLPPNEVFVDLYPEQQAIYAEMEAELAAMIGEHRDDQLLTPNALVKLVRLQQFACAYAEMNGNKVHLVNPSAKADKLTEMVESASGPVVVFSQFAEMADLVSNNFKKRGIEHGLYRGGIPKKQRDAIVDDFQDGNLQAFVGTIKAGGVGLNLTASSRVIRIDKDWVEALNRQAVDRVHRIGQTQPVQVQDLVANHTVDRYRKEKIELNWKTIKQLLGK